MTIFPLSNSSWSDENSEDSQNEEEDLVGNVVFVGYVFTNVCSHMQKKTDYVTIENAHCYNNTVSVDDVATSEKECDNFKETNLESNCGSEFDDDDLQEAYQQAYSQ